MGLPEININFQARAVSAIQRSAMGIVALVLRDETATGTTGVVKIKSVEDVKTTEWTAQNADYINQALLGTPSTVTILRVGQDDLIADVLLKLGGLKFNYLSMPDATPEEEASIASWIKSKRANDKKTFKAVLGGQDADDMGVINFTTANIVVGGKTYTPQQYTPRIAGILAGLPFTRSATYYVLPEVESFDEHTDPSMDIDNGELILVNDGENVKIGRAVNSLTTLTASQKEDYKKIKIVEVMDMITDDIRDTYNNDYVGKVINIYDNQVLFITAVNAYFKTLMGDQVLDPSYENMSFIDVNAQRLAWEGIGTDTTALDDQQVREMSFGSEVFLAGQVKITDAMEDLTFNILTV